MPLRPPSIDLSSLRLPETLDDHPGLLVGWSMEDQHPSRTIGFSYGDPSKTPSTGYVDPIQLSREGHLITLAPTGAGKGVGCIIPALLKHEGPVIVIDPKGENVAVTARRRREMGQQLIVLDPMGITDFPSDTLNPLDAIDVASPTAVDDVSSLVDSLWSSSQVESRDRFWVSRAKNLVTALILHTLVSELPERRSLTTVRQMIIKTMNINGNRNEQSESDQAFINDLTSSPIPEVRLLTGAIFNPAVETFGGIAAFALELLDFLKGPVLKQATQQSSFSLEAITRGDPLSIYLVLPPHMLESHGRLLRLWISTFIAAITRRRRQPERTTLFILDEAAQLGGLPQLRQAITLLRGYGLQTWSFWQDKSQLEMLYPNDWRTMINNCRVLQCFGALNMNAARDVADLTGFDNPNAVMDLNADEMVLQLAGDEAVVARLPNYLNDEPFAGQFDANPFYDKSQSILPAAHPLADTSLAGTWRKQSLEDSGGSVPLPQGDPDTLLARLLRDYDAGTRSVSG